MQKSLWWEYAASVFVQWCKHVAGPAMGVVSLGSLAVIYFWNPDSEWTHRISGFSLKFAVAMVLVAQYFVWKKERELRPQIGGEFYNFALGGNMPPPNSTLATFGVSVVSGNGNISIKSIKAKLLLINGEVEGEVRFAQVDDPEKLRHVVELKPGVHRLLACSVLFSGDFGFSKGMEVFVVDAFGLQHQLKPKGRFTFPFAEDGGRPS